MSMSPRQRLTAKIDSLPDWQRKALHYTALASAILTLAALMRPAISPGARVVIIATLDSEYVRTLAYQKDTLLAGVRHKTEVDSIFRMLRDDNAQHARTDSSLRCLRRNKPAWCD